MKVQQRSVRATVVGNRIHVKFPYSPHDNETLKAVCSARYSKKDEAHTMALTWENCIGLREVFGPRLVILPALRDWALRERARRESLEILRDGDVTDDDLSVTRELAPDLFKAVSSRRYQMAGAAFAITGRNVLLGDQPGLGKTYQALAAMVQSEAHRILVIAPRTAVSSVWDSHIKRLTPTIIPVVAQGTRRQRLSQIAEFNLRADGESGKYSYALVVNKEMIRVKRTWICDVPLHAAKGTDGVRSALTGKPVEWSKPPGKKGGCPDKDSHDHKTRETPEYPELFASPWDYIVMDECHHALASRYNVQSHNITQIRLGACRLPVSGDGYRLGMSGTPYRSKAQKAWGTLNWLQPKTFSSFWNWAGKHFEVTDGRYAREISATPNDPEAFADAMRPYLLARTKQEVAPELPPITYAGTSPDGSLDGPVGVWLEMDGPQAKAYESMRRLAEANVKDGRVTATGVLAELTRMKQFACSWAEADAKRNSIRPALPSNKFDWVLDFLREREGFGGKVIITSQFTSLLNLFDAELRREGFDPIMLTGATTDRGRSRFQEQIQDPDDPHWIGLLNMKAGGEAITLDQADDMIMLDLPWTDDEIRQVEDRLHRISRIHNVTVYRLQSRDTVEQRIAELTDQQRKDLMALRPTGRKVLAGILGGK